ncbi:nucleoid-associated protein [Capsulimonas corticalis]|uniref:Nucleoid-associated protein CCAX7_38710 n=1 Tax=Capsulimonas corticalis TaxID=2219043 RepID=A0A402D3N2_9BACT|nr:YbaB/EbfC family nucleoid-associated protein [Capsulimonas corticalis]BDI31820.1 nucleoid-associated protein [Capsulimonas corticalis]
MANPFGKLPGGLGDLMKQAQKAMSDAKVIEVELAQARVEGQAGGGLVKIVVTGKCDVVEVKIAKEAVDPDDVETLEDLITVAAREAIEKANALREEKLKSVMPAGMGNTLPGGFF